MGSVFAKAPDFRPNAIEERKDPTADARERQMEMRRKRALAASQKSTVKTGYSDLGSPQTEGVAKRTLLGG